MHDESTDCDKKYDPILYGTDAAALRMDAMGAITVDVGIEFGIDRFDVLALGCQYSLNLSEIALDVDDVPEHFLIHHGPPLPHPCAVPVRRH